MAVDKQIKLDPVKSILKYQVRDAMDLRDATFTTPSSGYAAAVAFTFAASS